MRKLLSFLPLIFVFTAGAQTVRQYPATTGQSFGMVVYQSTKAPAKAPLIVFLHGIGGAGNGSAADLPKLVADVPSEFKAMVETYGFIAVAVQSSSAFTLNEPGVARDWALKNLPVDSTRKYLTGMSWGGGGVGGFIKKSLENARLFDAAAPVAMTWQPGSGFKNVANAMLPVWIIHNLGDPNGGTPAAASKAYYDSLARWKPTIAPTITLLNYNTHAAWGAAYSPGKMPVPPGSQGTVAPAVNLAEWFLLNSSTNRVAVPSIAGPCTEQTALISFKLTGNNIALDGTGSCNYKSAEWKVTARPPGVSPWAPIITSGAMWYTAAAIFPSPGTYTITLITYSNSNYTGTAKTASITVTVGDPAPDPPKVAVGYDLVRKLVFLSDKSEEVIISAVQDAVAKTLTIQTDKGNKYMF